MITPDPIELGGALAAGPASVTVAAPSVGPRAGIPGYTELLTELTELVTGPNPVVVLHGPGGYGKTALARILAEDLSSTMPVWWVNAATAPTLADGLAEAALRSGAPPADVRAAWAGASFAPDLLWQALTARTDRWLLILNNAGSAVIDGGWLRTPTAAGTILLTTRDSQPDTWGDHATLLPVGAHNPGDSAAALLEQAPDAGDPLPLAARLGRHPLALRLAGAYLATEACTVEDYLAAWGHGADPMGRAVALSLDLLAQRGRPLARRLFHLLSFLAPAPIPGTKLDAELLAANELFDTITHAELDRILTSLAELELIAPVPGHDGSWVLHPLVREAGRGQADPGDIDEYRWLCMSLLCFAIGFGYTDHPGSWPVGRALMPHCVLACAQDDLDYEGNRKAAELADEAGHTYAEIGLPGDGEWFFRRAVVLNEAADGPDNERVADARSVLAERLRERGDLTSAERELREVLALRIGWWGADGEEVRFTRLALAGVLRDKGELSNLDTEYRDILAGWERDQYFGPEHAVTLNTRRELAILHIRQGQLSSADAELRAVLAIHQRLHGPDDAATLAGRRAVADLLWRRGDRMSAQAEYRDILAIEGRVYGTEHPSTLRTRQAFAALLETLGSTRPHCMSTGTSSRSGAGYWASRIPRPSGPRRIFSGSPAMRRSATYTTIAGLGIGTHTTLFGADGRPDHGANPHDGHSRSKLLSSPCELPTVEGAEPAVSRGGVGSASPARRYRWTGRCPCHQRRARSRPDRSAPPARPARARGGTSRWMPPAPPWCRSPRARAATGPAGAPRWPVDCARSSRSPRRGRPGRRSTPAPCGATSAVLCAHR